MKEKVSISIEREILEQIEILLKKPTFRNKSHVFEFAVTKLLDRENEHNN